MNRKPYRETYLEAYRMSHLAVIKLNCSVVWLRFAADKIRCCESSLVSQQLGERKALRTSVSSEESEAIEWRVVNCETKW